MSIFENIRIHSYCMFVGVFSIAIFMQAFFPIILKTGYHANMNDIPSKIDSEKVNLSDLYHSHVDRVILLVIDALRVDFINDSKYSHNMPYTNMLVSEEEAFVLVGHVHTPTVTMPRIKAMTTGTIPSFVDIINNLGSNSIEEDNLILQAESANKPVIFYGDETWLKLFPTSFKRKEGTTSFFVTDFIEVDNNVTRHLDNELRNKDWKMMILHYLGLDHIGHLEGPRSPHVKPKLQEMDSVIKKIHHKMKEWIDNLSEKSLLIICGDHGMKDSGGHGGASIAETTVPIIVVSLGLNASTTKRFFKEKLVSQVDIVPTLSVLLGLPIPKNNIGKIIPQFIGNIPKKKMLFALHYNAQQLTQQYMQTISYDTKDAFFKFQEAVRLHVLWLKSNFSNSHFAASAEKLYISSLHSMSQELSNTSVMFDMFQLLVSIFILIQVCSFLAFYNKYMKVYCENVLQYITCISIYTFINVFYCLSMESESNLCSLTVFSSMKNVLTLIILSVNTVTLINSFSSCFLPQPVANKVLCWVLIGSSLQCVSLLSSSFVEEEHQVWYFLWSTFLLLILLKHCQYCHRIGRVKVFMFIQCLGLLLCHRILRKLNQTGDKWAFLPDISDWLLEPTNKGYLSYILGFGLFGNYKFLCLIKRMFCVQSIFITLVDCLLTLLLLGSIYFYRAATGAVFSVFFNNNGSKGILEINFFWCLFFLLLGKEIMFLILRRENTRMSIIGNIVDLFVTLWVLLTSLLHRPHNVLLLCLQAWGSFFLGSLYQNTFKTKDDTRWVTFAHAWLGMVFYFYQGNSNSLATIDVASGYVGLQEYNPVIVGIFLTVNTFSAPIFSVFLLFSQLHLAANDRGFHWLWTHIGVAFHTLICHRLCIVTLSLVLLVIQRYHLFVWTVFSPKLLYESMYTLVQFLVMYLIYASLIIAFKCYPHMLKSKSNEK